VLLKYSSEALPNLENAIKLSMLLDTPIDELFACLAEKAQKSVQEQQSWYHHPVEYKGHLEIPDKLKGCRKARRMNQKNVTKLLLSKSSSWNSYTQNLQAKIC
jgi:DNA-binding XRE family transcriptional regulator